MFLLEGEAPPDHNTIARFRSRYLRDVVEDLFAQLVDILVHEGELSLLEVFVDGTKLESFANRYTFVWGKRVEKGLVKLQEKMKRELPEMARTIGVSFGYDEKIETHQLKKLLTRLIRKQRESNIEFVHGKGKHKTPLQRAVKKVAEYFERQKK
jgi:hypothetical protein